MKKNLLATLSAIFLLLAVASPASGTEPLHPDVEYAINAVPGGTVVDAYTVVWPDLGMTLTVPQPMSRAVGGCATGQYCAFSGSGLSGSKLTWGVCTIVSTAALSKVGSIANARAAGNVQARSSANLILASAAAGSSANVVGDVATLRCTL